MSRKSYSKKLIVSILLISLFTSNMVFASSNKPKVSVKGYAHIESHGDREGQSVDNDIYVLGTIGEGKRMEGICLELYNAPSDMLLYYRAHVQSHGDIPTKGTQDAKTIDDKLWLKGQNFLGTQGDSKRMEGIELMLVDKDTGEEYEGYSIEYQVHMQNYGWGIDSERNVLEEGGNPAKDMYDKWQKDGDFAGTRGESKRIEAIRIRIVKEGDDELKIHYIDVGQGDSTLIQLDNRAMLIDAGNASDGPEIVDYIKSQGINSLDYVIFTHPHADHIGGATDIVESFDIGKIIMPKVSHNTKTFESLLKAIKGKGMKITPPKPGETYELDEATFQILAPNSDDYKDLNDYSVVIRLVFGDTSFMFTGDAEAITENEILSTGFDIRSDILQVGHHGSDTSTTGEFLNEISPSYAIISCGRNNRYGHPDQSVLDRLARYGVELYRTDHDGTIVAISDGEDISFYRDIAVIDIKVMPICKVETKIEPEYILESAA